MTQIKKIRLQMKYSIGEFAKLLGILKPTYQGYDSGNSRTPEKLLREAQDAQKRDSRFFKELPLRVDEALGPNGCPNAARKSEW